MREVILFDIILRFIIRRERHVFACGKIFSGKEVDGRGFPRVVSGIERVERLFVVGGLFE
jgi:hypothetical protein